MTLSPTASTRPPISCPGTRGYRSPGHKPSLTNRSLWQMPHASTFTRTCPLPGSGMSRSTNSQSPPGLLMCAAFIFVFIKCLCFSFAPSWRSHFHCNLFFQPQELHRETGRCSKLCHFTLLTFVELKSFAKDTVEHSRRNEAVQPAQHHPLSYRVMQTR